MEGYRGGSGIGFVGLGAQSGCGWIYWCLELEFRMDWLMRSPGGLVLAGEGNRPGRL